MTNYNPMLDYQRNNLLAQQQMIQQQLNQLNSQRQTFNPYPQQTSDPFFVRQVGSVEEVKGFPVEPQTMYLFPDTGTGDIYLKRLNTDNGKSEIIVYKPQPTEKSAPVHEERASVPEIEKRLGSIEKKLGEVYESISGLKVYAEPVGSHATADAVKNAGPESSEIQPSNANAKRKI